MKKSEVTREVIDLARKIAEKPYQNWYWMYRQYWAKMLSMRQIAKKCGVDITTIRYWLNKFKIKRRTKSEGTKEYYKNHPHISRGQRLSEKHKQAFVNGAKKWKKENPDKISGENCNFWQGGKSINAFGYVEIHNPGNHMCQKGRQRVLEHRMIAEMALGRRLKKGVEIVHHINGNKADNRNKNLLICDNKYHKQLHHKMAQLYMQENFQ